MKSRKSGEQRLLIDTEIGYGKMNKLHIQSLVLLALTSMLSVTGATAQTTSNKSIRHGAAPLVKRPLPRSGNNTATYGNYPAFPCAGTGYRSYLPPTSLSSVDISVAEVDPPPPPVDTSGWVSTGQPEPRGVRGQ